MNQKIVYFIILIIGGILVVTQFPFQKDQNWEALYPNMPSRLTIDLANHTKSLYLLSQTHEPIFSATSNGSYSSKILSSFKRSEDNKIYDLCINDNLYFDKLKQNKFDVGKLTKYIKIKSKIFWNSNKVNINRLSNSCISVTYQKNNKAFINKFSKLENAPTIGVNELWANGLGQFQVTQFDDKKIILTRKIPIRKGFNTITVYNIDAYPEKINDKNIEDINHLYELPEWAKASYKNYPITDPKTVNLFINVEDKTLRSVLKNCINVSEFRKYFTNDGRRYVNIKNILPLGFYGSKPGLFKQGKCVVPKQYQGKKLVYLNWYHSSHESIKTYFKRFNQQTGLNVVIRKLKGPLSNEFYSKKHNYNLAVAAVSTRTNSYDDFFEIFTNPHGSLIDKQLKHLDGLVKRLDSMDSDEEKHKAIAFLLKNIDSENLYIPLYQTESDKYYPKHIKIKNYNFASLFYPNISGFRL